MENLTVQDEQLQPLQSPEQWDALLRDAGFSGIQLEAYDLPEPERHSCLLLSTALGERISKGH